MSLGGRGSLSEFVKECRGGHAPPLAIDNVDVDVDVDVVVDLVVDTTGHPLATDVSHCGLGSALGTSSASCLQSLGRVQVHVHVHDDVHDHVATCPPDTFTGSQASDLGNCKPGPQASDLRPQVRQDRCRWVGELRPEAGW